jgi:hypothetical protein
VWENARDAFSCCLCVFYLSIFTDTQKLNENIHQQTQNQVEKYPSPDQTQPPHNLPMITIQTALNAA